MIVSKLRFGIIVEDICRFQEWQRITLETLRKTEIAEPVFVLNMVSQPAQNNLETTSVLWKICQIYYTRTVPLARYVDDTSILDGCGTLQCRTEGDVSQEVIAHIKSYRLDFFLNFAQCPIHRKLAVAARYGVWSYCHGGRLQTTFPGFWEVYHNRIIESFLYATYAENETIRILHAVKVKSSWSYRRTVDDLLSLSTDWGTRVCKEIALAGTDALRHKAVREDGMPSRQPPSNRQCLIFLWRQLKAGIQEILDTLFYFDIWNVGMMRRSIKDLKALSALHHVHWLPAHKPLRYIADPFIFTFQSRPFLAVENYSHHRGRKGQIARLKLDGPSDELDLEEAIIAPQHLSYPYILTIDGQTYCIPEIYQAHQCRVYKLTESGEFVCDRVLIDGIGVVDPTVFFHNHFWWLFFTDIDRGSRTTLFAYYTRDFYGTWQPHFLNPLKCDVTSARPAGKPFTLNGKLYRPAQDCSETYGGAITILEIIDLSPTTFHEVPVLYIHPDPAWPYPDGIHHLIVEDGRIIIDAKRRRFDWLFKLKQCVSGAA